MPNSIAANAPITVVYVSPTEELVRAYLLAANKKLLTIERPSVCDVFKLLHGCYYAYDRNYPVSCQNVLEFFDYAILNKQSENKSKKFANFVLKFSEIRITTAPIDVL